MNASELTSSLIIDKVTKSDAGIYTCLVKNTLKYANGSAIEKFDKAQTHVTVECKEISAAFGRFRLNFRCADCQFAHTYSRL